MPASVEWFDDLEAVATDAAGALDRAHQPRLFDRIAWFRLIRHHILADARLLIARAAQDTDRTWLMLIQDGRRRAAPLASWYSLAFGPIKTGNGIAPLVALLRALAKRCDRVCLQPIADDDLKRLTNALTAAGWRSFASRSSANWSIEIAGRDFAAYWAARPARLRNTVSRRTKSHPVVITIYRAFDIGAWADYEAVYAASWKPAEGSLPFLRALAEQEGAAGTLRLGIAHDAHGRAVAAQLWLVENGVATIHKLAHREDARSGSPGSILSHALFRAAIDEDRVRRIDFGLGDEPYKADWMERSQPAWRIDAYRPTTISGATGILREIASRLARRRPLD